MERPEEVDAMVGGALDFHDAVYAAAHHSRLEAAWQAIRSQVHLFLLTRIALSDDDYTDHIPAEHRDLAHALRARDSERALQLFSEDRSHAFELLINR